MELLRCKARIALLWVFMAVAMSAHSLFAVMTPGGLEKTISEVEAMGPEMLVFNFLAGSTVVGICLNNYERFI